MGCLCILPRFCQSRAASGYGYAPDAIRAAEIMTTFRKSPRPETPAINRKIKAGDVLATLPRLVIVVAKRPPTSPRLNAAPSRRHIVFSPNDSNKSLLPLIGCCRERTSRLRALPVSTHALLQRGRHVG